MRGNKFNWAICRTAYVLTVPLSGVRGGPLAGRGGVGAIGPFEPRSRRGVREKNEGMGGRDK